MLIQDITKPLFMVLQAAGVRRYHTRHVLQQQTNAEHMFNVAWFCWALTARMPSAALLLHAMAHDLPEHITGDIPAHSKKNPQVAAAIQHLEDSIMEQHYLDEGLPMLLPEEEAVLKVADTLDLLAYCFREKRMGNRMLMDIEHRGMMYLKERREAIADEGMQQRIDAILNVITGATEYER